MFSTDGAGLQWWNRAVTVFGEVAWVRARRFQAAVALHAIE
jgi:hypothetical protein